MQKEVRQSRSETKGSIGLPAASINGRDRDRNTLGHTNPCHPLNKFLEIKMAEPESIEKLEAKERLDCAMKWLEEEPT